MQEALQTLISDREMRLLGGDGQAMIAAGQVVQRPVRVAVDDGLVLVEDARCPPWPGIVHRPGLVAQAEEGEFAPPTLAGTGATDRLRCGPGRTAWLSSGGSLVRRRLAGPRSTSFSTGPATPRSGSPRPRRLGGRRAPFPRPAHRIAAVRVANCVPQRRRPYRCPTSASGIVVRLNGPAAFASVIRQPVIRVELDLPWPVGPDTPFCGVASPDRPPLPPIATRTSRWTACCARPATRSARQPQPETGAWLRDQLFKSLARGRHGSRTARCSTAGDPGRGRPTIHINTNAEHRDRGRHRPHPLRPAHGRRGDRRRVRAVVPPDPRGDRPGVPVPAMSAAQPRRRPARARGSRHRPRWRRSRVRTSQGHRHRTDPGPGVVLPAGSAVGSSSPRAAADRSWAARRPGTRSLRARTCVGEREPVPRSTLRECPRGPRRRRPERHVGTSPFRPAARPGAGERGPAPGEAAEVEAEAVTAGAAHGAPPLARGRRCLRAGSRAPPPARATPSAASRRRSPTRCLTSPFRAPRCRRRPGPRRAARRGRPRWGADCFTGPRAAVAAASIGARAFTAGSTIVLDAASRRTTSG